MSTVQERPVAPVPVPPTRGRPMIPVYNPADNPENPIAYGHYFGFSGNAITYVGDIWDWPRDEDNRLITEGVQRTLLVDAWAVAELLCGPESMGPRGFIILQGNEDQQRAAMQDARGKWLTVKSDEVDAIIESFEVMAHEYMRMSPNPSRPGLRPGRRVQAAFHWRETHREELAGFGIELPTPYTPTRDGQGEPPALARASNEEERKAIITGSTLLGRALERGIELSVGDMKGLTSGDTDVIADVEAKLDPPKRPTSKASKKDEATKEGATE